MEKVQSCTSAQVSPAGAGTMLRSVQKPVSKKYCLLACFFLFAMTSFSQFPDAVYKSNIQSVRLHMYGDQQSLPVYNLNSTDQLELHFDDMEGKTKSYYDTFLLCDYNWLPVNMSSFDYIKVFKHQHITTYRYPSLS